MINRAKFDVCAPGSFGRVKTDEQNYTSYIRLISECCIPYREAADSATMPTVFGRSVVFLSLSWNKYALLNLYFGFTHLVCCNIFSYLCVFSGSYLFSKLNDCNYQSQCFSYWVVTVYHRYYLYSNFI